MGFQRKLILCFLLATVASVYSEVCPPLEDINPCICDKNQIGDIKVTCKKSDMRMDILKKVLSSLRGSKNIELVLTNLVLDSLSSDLFEDLHIRTLRIDHCRLASLTDNAGPALKDLENSLEELYISSSLDDSQLNRQSDANQQLHLGHMKKLKKIELSRNTLTEFNNDRFKGPQSLTELIINENAIEKIGNKALAELNNLKVLSLSGNKFGVIKRSMLPSAPMQLHNLTLDFNELKEIPDDLLLLMPSLKIVSLRGNKISELHQRTWLTLWRQLQIIYLEGNPLNCDSHMHWLFHVSMAKPICGTCSSPKEKKGLHLRDIIELNPEPSKMDQCID